MTNQDQNTSLTFKKALIVLAIIILVLVVGSHLLLPLFGVVVAMTAIAWAFLVGTIVLFSLGVLLFFLLPWIAILVLCVFAFVWLVVAIALFPFLFPILAPIFIIFLFVAFMRRRSTKEQAKLDVDK